MPKSTPRRSATDTCFRRVFPAMMSCLVLICSTISLSVKPSGGCSVFNRSYTRTDFLAIFSFLLSSVGRSAVEFAVERNVWKGSHEGKTSWHRSPEVGPVSNDYSSSPVYIHLVEMNSWIREFLTKIIIFVIVANNNLPVFYLILYNNKLRLKLGWNFTCDSIDLILLKNNFDS